MIRVYVAGPYTSPDPAVNTANAMAAGHQLMDLGYWPYIPHLSHFMHIHRQRPYEDWMRLDKKWLEQCEAVLRLPGTSPGADEETVLAHELGIPVFRDFSGLVEFFREEP